MNFKSVCDFLHIYGITLDAIIMISEQPIETKIDTIKYI